MIKYVKSIPKYMIEKIRKTDLKKYEAQDGHVRFYAYLAVWSKELVKVTVAVKNHKKKWYCKQVVVHGIESEKCVVRDMEYNSYLATGYSIGWHDMGIQPRQKWFEDSNWYTAADKAYDPWAYIVNGEFVTKMPEFRYSAYDLYQGCDVLQYLRLYRQYPQIELLIKLGFARIAQSKMILKLTAKDKAFCKWLIRNKEQILGSHCYIDVIIRAYRTGRDIANLQAYRQAKLALRTDSHKNEIKELFKGKDLERFFDYIAKQKTNISSYCDYIKACKYLSLDLTKEKNLLPHDFKRWHDIRTDEYATQKALEDEEKRKELCEKFAEIARKYTPLEHAKKSAFVCIIAKSPTDLIREGEVLHHCVGRMNYDQRFVREESLIFFIRNRQEPDTPLVTVEYSVKERKVLQCYGDHDSKPSDDILRYVNKIWLPYARKTIKNIA